MTRKCSRRKERREYKPTGAAASCSPQPVGAVPRTPAARSGGPWAAPTVPCARASPTLSSTPLRAGHLSPAARPPALGASSRPSGSGFGFRPERGGGGGVTKLREQQRPVRAHAVISALQGLTAHEHWSPLREFQCDLHSPCCWCNSSPGVRGTGHPVSAPPAPSHGKHPHWAGGRSRSKHRMCT